MFYFPKENGRRSVWASIVNRDDWQPSHNSVLCLQHFSADDLSFNSSGKITLSKKSVPTIIHPGNASASNILSDSELLDVQMESVCDIDSISEVTDGRLNEDRAAECENELMDEQTIDHDYASRPNESNSFINNDYNIQLIEALRKEIKILKRQLVRSEEMKKRYKKKLVRLTKMQNVNSTDSTSNALQKVLNCDQIEVLNGKNQRNIKWSVETIEKSLRIKFACGSRGYKYLSTLFPLPSQSTLSRKIQGFKFNPGVNNDIFHFLGIKFHHLDDETHRDCALFVDEMKIIESRDFDNSTKNIIGNVTMPQRKDTDATHGLVVMLAGIKAKWKQVVAYHYTAQVRFSIQFAYSMSSLAQFSFELIGVHSR